MKKLLIMAMIGGVSVAAHAQTTFTQVWRLDTVNGGGPAWFLGDVARTIRSATHHVPSDNILVLERAAKIINLRKLNPVTGAEVAGSPYQALDLTAASSTTKGTFVGNTIDTDDANVIYFCNLTVAVDRVTGEPFIVYRMADASTAPTVAYEVSTLTTPATPAEFAKTRFGDTLQVVGTGTGTEIYAGGSWGAGYTDATDVRDLLKLTTVDGLNFTLAANYNLSDAVVDFGTVSANRLGLAVMGTGASADVWGDASGLLAIPRKYNLATNLTTDRLDTTVFPLGTGHTGLGLTTVGSSKFLVSAPGAYTASGPYGAPWNLDDAQKSYVFDVTNAAAPTLVGQTEKLGLFAGTTAAPTTNIWHTNPDGTSAVFFDNTRNNFGVVLVNNSISMHNFGSASVQDWNLF
ncbi:hypothetical protein CVU37_12425 [candidate division BRC1 bacterium HGW-BRC1-1]|nr:MAG: hypothetical protein CVU37_12425 [candidate division BRC1 bacterium HGW-BRC1-1]